MKCERDNFLKKTWCKHLKVIGIILVISLVSYVVMAQSGEAGIKKANEQVRLYFKEGTSLMYAIGAVVGLIGAIKVYQKWNSGDQDTSKIAAAWFGSCIFLVVVTTVIKAFFSV